MLTVDNRCTCLQTFILFYFIYFVKLSPLFDATSYGEIKIVNN